MIKKNTVAVLLLSGFLFAGRRYSLRTARPRPRNPWPATRRQRP